MNSYTHCPIWNLLATEFSTGSRDGRDVDSPRAGGRYFISGSAETNLNNFDTSVKVRLTTWLVDQRRLGNTVPEITTKTVKNAKYWKDLDVSERADRLLRYQATRTEILGTLIHYRIPPIMSGGTKIDDQDKVYCEMLAHSECFELRDLAYLMEYLKGCGLIEIGGINNREQSCTVTIDGFKRLAYLKETHSISRKAFVAMWFDESMDVAWERGFEPAIRNAGYEPIRIDKREHIEKIDDEIIAEIRRSCFVVADFTHGDKGARGGVYYEAGFAHGLGIPVIFTCREDSFGTVHFDIRQYNHIVWLDLEELKKNLSIRIGAVIGDGPNKTPD